MENQSWKEEFEAKLPIYGHWNWIMVVDKAFPSQVAPGIETIHTGEKLLPVLDYVSKRIGESDHIEGVYHTDLEFNYIPKIFPGAPELKAAMDKLFASRGITPEPIIHSKIMDDIVEIGKKFKIMFLKTTEVIPYSSVYIYLGCGYWNDEPTLRALMAKDNL